MNCVPVLCDLATMLAVAHFGREHGYVLSIYRRSQRYMRLHAEPSISRRTSFFAAAAVVTRVLAWHRLSGFLLQLSAVLEQANARRAQLTRVGMLYTEGTLESNTRRSYSHGPVVLSPAQISAPRFEIGKAVSCRRDSSTSSARRRAMNVVHLAVTPRVLMPPTMMLTIVVALLVALFIPGVGVVMNYFSILYDTTG